MKESEERGTCTFAFPTVSEFYKSLEETIEEDPPSAMSDKDEVVEETEVAALIDISA